MDVWFGIIAMSVSIITTLVGCARYLAKQQTARAVSDARLADAVDRLTNEISEVVDAIKHLDDRVDNHDTRISVLENRNSCPGT